MRENLYFFQFSDTYNDEAYLPYSTGLLWAYARTDALIAQRYHNRGFRFIRARPDDIVASLDTPTVAAFSTYVWNWEMSIAVAQRIKHKYPECLIIFGGPQVPRQMQGFFAAHPYVDIAVHGEGEITFAALLREHVGGRDYASIPGLTWNDGNGGKASSQQRERITDLDRLPSPYLTGVFDELFSSLPYKWQAVWETNRGCPYQCTFCDWGSAIATKLRIFAIDRLEKEIEFFGQKKITFIYSGDANFGILKRDLEIAEALARTKAAYGYPSKFRANYAKNSTERVTEIAKILNREKLDKGITLSVQSMDGTTLNNIKRTNMKIESLSGFIKEYQRYKIPTYTEVMIGMPGETYTSFKEGINKLLDAGAHDSLYIYRSIILPNCELNDPDYKALHEIRSVRTRTALEHSLPSTESVPEYEDMIISTKTMPTEDWISAFVYAWAIQAFHALNLTQVVALCVRRLRGVQYSEFYQRLIEFGEQHPETLLGAELRATRDKVEEVLQGGNWDILVQEFSDLTWPPEEATYLRVCLHLERFYQELETFLSDFSGLQLDAELQDSLLRYQKALVVRSDADGSQTLVLRYAWHHFYCSELQGEPSSLLRGRFELAIVDHFQFRGDRRRYANEIVFWGRRGGKTIYQDVSETTLAVDVQR